MQHSTKETATKKHKSGRSAPKKAIGFIHLWMGLVSGALIIFLALTGCILAFEKEIRDVSEPFRFVEQRDQPFAAPSRLLAVAGQAMQRTPYGIEYPGPGKAAISGYYDENTYILVFLDPYTGRLLKMKDMNKDFFRIVLNGHYYLWLPPAVGQPVVASATLVFLFMLVSGIVLWWPRNKAARKQRFSVKWSLSRKRLNYDLHNVLGFYASWFAVVLAVTGLVWGFQWFSRTMYFVASGGKALPPHEHPVSDTLLVGKGLLHPEDRLYAQLKPMAKAQESVSIFLPQRAADPIEGAINHRPGTYYNTDYYHYDQYTLKPLPATGVYAGSFASASIADKLQRMNYDIHVGAVLGLPGKILAFCISLICTTLPVTGFLIWKGRRKKKRAPKIVNTTSRVSESPIAVIS